VSLKAWKPEDISYKPGDLYIGVDYQMYQRHPRIGYIKAQ
jgi:hypothetical protein